MIFYFTGTGNSYHVAKILHQATNEPLIDMAEAMKQKKYEFDRTPEERVGFVFPVYYWGMPTIVEDFLEKLSLKNPEGGYAYAIITCGSTIGTTMTSLNKLLKKRKIALSSGYSIAYPDNYVLLYDVLNQEEQKKHLNEADQVLNRITKDIVNKKKGVWQVSRGKAPHLLSGLFHFYYKRNRKTSKFFATKDCTSCGLCERICPLQTITLKEGNPVWGKECTQCLGCIHRCPVHAIQYGKGTIKRGRYIHPDLLS